MSQLVSKNEPCGAKKEPCGIKNRAICHLPIPYKCWYNLKRFCVLLWMVFLCFSCFWPILVKIQENNAGKIPDFRVCGNTGFLYVSTQ